jgi:hypothetical protein
MRLFGIYNRGYNLRYVIADSIEQALALAFQAGHIRRQNQYRRWTDLTDDPPPELEGQAQKLIDEGRAGVLTAGEHGWQVSV